MKKLLLSAACLLASLTMTAQDATVFAPYKATNLRLPAVPILLNDPYFSIWSPYNKLNEGNTCHWTSAEKPFNGFIRVDGTLYRFMGANKTTIMSPIAGTTEDAAWEAKATQTKPADGWQKPGFDDASWGQCRAPFGDRSNVRTRFEGNNKDLYIRRVVNLTEAQLKKDLYLYYSHDDVFELYINGTQVISTGETWQDDLNKKLDSKTKALLHAGENIIATHTHNTTGGAYTDFGLYADDTPEGISTKQAEQKSVSVLATNTYYTFKCGPVDLNLVFTAPMLIDDLDLLSTPINYISYQVSANDNKEHKVQVLFTASPMIGVNSPSQPTVSSTVLRNGVKYLKTGTLDQPILKKKGDIICIDWGYFYLPNINGTVSLDSEAGILKDFAASGALPQGKDRIVSRSRSEMPTLAYTHDFESVREPKASFCLMGYDEVQDIEYMYKRYKAYWAHDGKVTIFDAFDKLNNEYNSIMSKCRALDQRIYDDGFNSGGQKYAEILSGSYRHVIAAHKLFKDDQGTLLFFSKENNSNGSVNTVDLTYPEAPLFLCYNPELQKAMMTSIFDYSLSGRWVKPFAAHDQGTYPIADGQTYGGDMPLEESGNMLTLAAMLCKLDGNTKYVDKYWNVLKTWVDYLVANGQDPANQLCTDDFAGHWAHNCNLSVKAIMGIAAYSIMADMRGDKAEATKYMNTAKTMAQKWEKDARDGDHYRLAFDRPNTWSMKYNLVWDRLWNLNIFPSNPIDKEIKYYLTKQNKYGLPLDCRKDYTKNDWIMWTAGMAKDKKTFTKLMLPVYDFINETESRVPISDWYDTKTGRWVSFRARSVIGGFWMRVLADKLAEKK